jgi:hypothetical protein
MHTSSAPAELDLPATPDTPAAPAESPTTPPGRTRSTSNHLTLKQTSLLYIWLDQPENRDYVAKESDADTAIKAAEELGFPVSTGNITGTRKALEIAKIKPEKPAETPNVDLILLQKQLDTYGQQVQRQAIAADTIHDVLNLLIAHVLQCEAILKLLARGKVGTELSMAGLNDLPPLTVFPTPTTSAT